MNKKDFKIYREGYMLGVKETLEMIFEWLSIENTIKSDKKQRLLKGK